MSAHERVTAVTGGSRGIGAATVRRLAEAGHGVVVGFARDREAAEAVAAEVGRAGSRAVALQVDVTDAASLARFFDDGAARLGPLTGVVANAGAVSAVGRLTDLDPEALRRDLDVNLLGAVLTCQAAIAHLERTAGTLVLVGSAAATIGSPGSYVHYAAAKAGVAALAVGLSKELAPSGIRVNCVEPGTVWSDFHQDPQRPAKVAAGIPLGRAGEPHEISGAIAWLLSDEASYTTGATFRIAGGL
ncbi:SDR family NAD(P)-dependent oxidoreductase [Microbacterium sp. CFBP9034]|uniref:SDR family NAD(P)-dependent oxidoreductase n=1 Tax=Microbacterium sp. CFBP9034 TaxID=3096540 RepID=UPI002A6B2A45|nr:SDR family oxidoreductase [Microbacterium sp. CFBP9034]MDY0910177.1 SDR family oxidoreductase [Microbacterium sp. CFBP9034]